MPALGEGMPELGDGIPELGEGIPELGEGIPELGDEGMPEPCEEGIGELGEGIPELGAPPELCCCWLAQATSSSAEHPMSSEVQFLMVYINLPPAMPVRACTIAGLWGRNAFYFSDSLQR
jgi:hypothetical protein